MFKLEKHPNGYASIIGHGLQSQDARTVSYAEGERLVATFDNVESGLREDLRVQVEAKCKAIKRVEAFESAERGLIEFFRKEGADYGRLGDCKGWSPVETAVHALHDLTVKNRDLTEKLERSNAGVSLMSKKLIAKRDLCEKLVTLVNEPERAKKTGTAPDDVWEGDKPTNWPYWATHLFRDQEGWQFGKLFIGAAGKSWYDSDTQATATRVWNEKTIIDGTLEERPSFTLKTATNAAGQEYVCGLGAVVDPQQFIVEADKVYINGAMIADATLDEARVVNVTTNHFGPEPKASKKQLAALKSALTLIDHEGREDIHKHLRKLLKKLS